MSVVLECSGCSAKVELAPVPDQPGYVSITNVDGWTSPPVLCPECSVPGQVRVNLIANMLEAGRIVGLDPREMTRLALEQLERESPHE